MSAWGSAFFLLSFAAISTFGIGHDQQTQARVDLIEHNHFIDRNGREVFQQVIFYDWSPSQRRYHCRAWRLIKHADELPVRCWSPTRYQCSWNEDGLKRQVWAPIMRETWSQQDPERENRKFLAEDRRVPLWPRPTTNQAVDRIASEPSDGQPFPTFDR